jgi:recombination protein RecT
MANVSDAKKQLAKNGDDEHVKTLLKRVEAMGPQIKRVLPQGLEADRMIRLAVTLVRRTPKMGLVTPDSFLGAFMTSNQLGLEPGGPLGQAWIIPREVYDNGRPTGIWEAHFQLGYKGAIELARRTGEIAKITCRTVYAAEHEKDLFDVHYEGADEFVRHTPLLIGDRGEPVLYYCAAKLTNGEQTFTPLQPGDVENRHRKIGRGGNSPAWTTHYEKMAWKSCVVEARTFWPMSVELERAIAHDGIVRTDTTPEVLETAPAGGDWIDGEATEWPPTAPVPPSPPAAADSEPAAEGSPS